MLATKVICPHCAKHLKTSKPLTVGHRVLCSRCGRSFAVPPDALAETAVAAAPGTQERPSPPPTLAAPLVMHAAANGAGEVSVAPRAANRALWIGVILGGLLLLMGTTVGLAVFFATRGGTPNDGAQASASASSEISARTDDPSTGNRSEDPLSPPPPPPAGSRSEPPVAGDPPALPTPEPEPANALPPEEQKKVNAALDKGVQWLKARQKATGTWGGQGLHSVGLAALPALTLLECGVPANDVRVQRALKYVRQAIPTLDRTYELALAILFLDRLGNPADEERLRTCALRLVAGQMPSGGWSYQCHVLTAEQEHDLLTVLEHTRPASGLDLFTPGPGGSLPPGFITQAPGGTSDKNKLGGDTLESKFLPEGATVPLDENKKGKPRAADPQAYKKALDRLPSNLRKVPALQPPAQSHRMPSRDNSDNSNTQFAILGLSAAHRHRLPLDRALALIVQRFRTSQVPDGRFDYHYIASPRGITGGTTPAMTGAGLLGLAVGIGLAADHAQKTDRPAKFEDPAVEKGFTALSAFVGQPLGKKNPRVRGREPINLYFLWTVERCGVLFNRTQIGGKDWYPWGVELLRDNQNADGSWSAGGYPGAIPIVDTCFALLFLKRANLAKELTKKLEFFMEGKNLH
jgi:hypothetical protein